MTEEVLTSQAKQLFQTNYQQLFFTGRERNTYVQKHLRRHAQRKEKLREGKGDNGALSSQLVLLTPECHHWTYVSQTAPDKCSVWLECKANTMSPSILLLKYWAYMHLCASTNFTIPLKHGVYDAIRMVWDKMPC